MKLSLETRPQCFSTIRCESMPVLWDVLCAAVPLFKSPVEDESDVTGHFLQPQAIVMT